MYISIPKKGTTAEVRKTVEQSLPEPLEVAGWKFKKYKWCRIDQINTKDKDGNSDNTVRLGGTGTNDVLRTSLGKGLSTDNLTPSIFPNNNLLNGFNRVKNLQLLGHEEWIFAEYEIDKSTKTEFQQTDQDYIDDFRAASNGGDGAKVITTDELKELGRKRFEHRDDRSKKAIARWVHSLDLNLSRDQVNGIAQTVSKQFKRHGIINSYSRIEAEEKAKNIFQGAYLINTKDSTRTLRCWPRLMKNFINTGEPLKLVTFHSDATSHKQVDDGRKECLSELNEVHMTTLRYVSQCTGIQYSTLDDLAKRNNSVPFECLGHLAQKIGVEKDGPDGLAIKVEG